MIRTERPRPIKRPSAPPHRIAPGLADQYAQIGLNQRAETIRSTFARAATINSGVVDIEANLAQARDLAVEAIKDGTSTPEGAARVVDASTRLGPLATELAQAARGRLISDLARSMWSEGDALVAELDAVVQAHVAILVADADALDGIDTDQAAIKAGAKVAAAWSRAGAAVTTIAAAQTLAHQLRMAGFVPELRDADYGDWSFHDPEHVALDLDPKLHAVPRLIAHIAAGARPGCCTADSIVELGFLQ